MKKLGILFMVWAITLPAMAQSEDTATDEALERAVLGADYRSRVSDPASITVTEGGVVLGVKPFDNPGTYVRAGLRNLKEEPSSWLSRNWGKTILGGLASWYATNPDGFNTSMEDLWSKMTGDDSKDDQKDRKRNEGKGSEGNTALKNSDESDDLVVSGDGNNIDVWNESIGDIVVDGDGNSVSINREAPTEEEPVAE